MVGIRRGLTVLVLCLFATAMLAASTSAFAEFPLYEPNYDYRVVEPYQAVGIAEKKELKNVSYKLTDCVWTMTSFDLFKPAIEVHKKERTVTVFVPAAMDLTNERIINGLVLYGWKVAWKNCFSSYVQNDTNFTEFSGVRVLVVQRKERIIQTGPVLVADDKSIYIDTLDNLAATRKAEKIQAKQVAETQSQQVKDRRLADARTAQTYQSMFFIFKAILGLAVIVLLFRYLPPLLTRIRWFFSPHPALREVRKATRIHGATYVNGNALSEGLSFIPANATEAELARRDLAKMKQDAAAKNEVIEAQIDLEYSVIELQRKQKRVELLQKASQKYGK